MSFVENCCVFVLLREGDDSSESCLLLLSIAKKTVEVLKQKVLILFERFFLFLISLILEVLLDSRLGKRTPGLHLAVAP